MPLLILLLIMSSAGYSQEIDILLKGGHVIDPANHIDAVMDVAISDGRIAPNHPHVHGELPGLTLKKDRSFGQLIANQNAPLRDVQGRDLCGRAIGCRRVA